MHPQFNYPEFELRMCPQFKVSANHQPLRTLPYKPRFEVVNEKHPPYSVTCNPDYFAKVGVDNVHEAEVKYSCRGYWYWRPGAAGMFDLGSGKVLQKLHLAMPAAERLLNTWVVQDDGTIGSTLPTQ
ncbi:hypothetical protein RCH14_000961 [Massilia sp. MP_M2]|uniref:hypothetical protein n=1 Tax=Massilia sp. MP_M2 TaxID=3071713 RepID=UPI00319E85B3